ncbi:Hypothetical protein SCF082_LOCUS21792 [Durusdinium trenchii]
MGSALSTEELRSVTSALQKLSEKDKKVQEKAAAEVCEMADDEEMRKEIMKPEMLTALMKGGQLGSPKARKIVVRTTMVLADHSPSRCKMLIKAGAMDVLHSLALAKKSTSEAKRLVANCAWQLLRYDHEVNNIDNMPEDPQLIEALVCCVKSAAKEGKERASDVLRWLGKKETNRAKIVEASGLETLARLARCGTQRERSSAQRALEELDETTIEDKSGKARAESRRKAFRPFSLYRMLPSRMWTLLGWRAKRMQEAAFKDASITPLEGSHLSFNTPSQVAAMDAPQALVPAVSFSTAKRPPDSVRRRWQRLSCEAEVEDEDSEEYMIDMPEDPQVIKDFVCSVKSEAGEGKAGATEVEDVVDASLDSLQTLACFGTDEQKNFAEQTLKELLVGEFSSAIEQLKDDDEKVQEEAAAKLCELAKNHKRIKPEFMRPQTLQTLMSCGKSGTEKTQRRVVKTLIELTDSSHDCKIIRQVGAIDFLHPLVSESTSRKSRELVAQCTWNLLRYENDDNMPEDHQLIAALVSSATSAGGEGKRFAVGVLGWLGKKEINRAEIVRACGLETLVCLERSGTQQERRAARCALEELAKAPEIADQIEELKSVKALGLRENKSFGKAEKQSDGRNATPAPLTATTIQSGKGTPVAMFSLRFDGGEVEKNFRAVHALLQAYEYDVLMVDADAGDNFGILTTEYLSRVKNENGVMLAVCTETYGEMTTSPYCSGKEVQYASDYKIQVVPLWAAGVYPPKPPGCGQSYVDMIFRPNLVYLDCREKSIQQIAADIANRLHRCSSKSRSGSA